PSTPRHRPNAVEPEYPFCFAHTRFPFVSSFSTRKSALPRTVMFRVPDDGSTSHVPSSLAARYRLPAGSAVRSATDTALPVAPIGNCSPHRALPLLSNLMMYEPPTLKLTGTLVPGCD